MNESHEIDIDKILEEITASKLENDERQRFLCELLLQEFKQMTAEDLHKHFKDMVVPKNEREVILRLAFKF